MTVYVIVQSKMSDRAAYDRYQARFFGGEAPPLERDDFSSIRHLAQSFCWSMISAQTLRVCREGKPVPTFPDHALASYHHGPKPNPKKNGAGA
jgi:hypothetical protein